MTCPGRVRGTDVCILVPHHSNCPTAALLWQGASSFPNAKEVAWKLKGMIVIHCKKPLLVQQGLGEWGKVDDSEECVEESRRLELGSFPLIGPPRLPMWALTQLFCHAGSFLQTWPLHLPQGALQNHCSQCPTQSAQLSYLHLSFTFQEPQLA